MRALCALDGPINDVATAIEFIENEAERKTYRRAIAEMMADVYTELMIPILRDYPDLDPDRDPKK